MRLHQFGKFARNQPDRFAMAVVIVTDKPLVVAQAGNNFRGAAQVLFRVAYETRQDTKSKARSNGLQDGLCA